MWFGREGRLLYCDDEGWLTFWTVKTLYSKSVNGTLNNIICELEPLLPLNFIFQDEYNLEKHGKENNLRYIWKSITVQNISKVLKNWKLSNTELEIKILILPYAFVSCDIKSTC